MPMFEKKEEGNVKQNNSEPQEAETVIGRGVRVGGNFVSKGNVIVKGIVTAAS